MNEKEIQSISKSMSELFRMHDYRGMYDFYNKIIEPALSQNTRTISEQGKLHTDVERIIDKVYMVSSPAPMQPDTHINDPIIEIRESALREVLINNQLTQLAPVSVEDCVSAIVNQNCYSQTGTGPKMYTEDQIKSALQTLFNTK